VIFKKSQLFNHNIFLPQKTPPNVGGVLIYASIKVQVYSIAHGCDATAAKVCFGLVT